MTPFPLAASRAGWAGAGVLREKEKGFLTPFWLAVVCVAMVCGASGCACPDACSEWFSGSPAVVLPADEAAHCYGGEWWYYTGLLTAEDGREYGFEAVIFHRAPGVFMGTPEGLPLAAPVDAYVAHFAITDVADGTFAYDQIRTLEPQAAIRDGFHLVTPLVTLQGGGGQDQIHGAMPDGRYELDLALQAEGEPVLHGDGGYVRYGPMGNSFYYSRPRMTATGLLRDGDEELAVDGEVWFDRQWGHDVNDPFLKWVWFSIRLDDGTAIMLYRFLDGEPFVDEGMVRSADGGTQPLMSGDFAIRDEAFWTSPESGATYPVRWQVEIPAAGLVLDVNRSVDDQELDARATTLNVYWEGLCFVSGTRDGQPVAGHAYVEMTNFDL